MIVQVLKQLSAAQTSRITRVLLLFPTLMEIADTPNGRRQGTSSFTRVSSSCGARFISWLPAFCRHAIIRSGEGMSDLPPQALECSDRFLASNSVSNALFLFQHEAAQIKKLDADVLTAHSERITVYFGATDGWAPLTHRDEIMRNVPGLRVLTDEQDIPHAFSLRDSEPIAQMCWQEVAGAFSSSTGAETSGIVPM
jgi:hypothetical protein